MLELVDHQPIDTQPLEGDRSSGNVTANTFELLALMGFGVANLRNSTRLRAIRALNLKIFDYNLLRPE